MRLLSRVAGLPHNYDGTLDMSFNGGNLAGYNDTLGQWTYAPSRMLVQPDGGIVMVGLLPDGQHDDLALARYLADGTSDTNFGPNGDGSQIIPLGQAAGSCDAALESGGRIVVAVGLDDGTVELKRITSAGVPDSSFGSEGTVTASTVTSNPILAIQPDGQILLAGDCAGGNFALLRYLADGSGVDTTFASGDTNNAAIGPFAQPTGMAILPGGRIIVAGIDSSGSSDQWALTGFEAAEEKGISPINAQLCPKNWTYPLFPRGRKSHYAWPSHGVRVARDIQHGSKQSSPISIHASHPVPSHVVPFRRV